MNTCETCICYYEDKDMGGTIAYCEHVNTPKEPLQDTTPCKYYLHKNIIKKYEDYGNLALYEEMESSTDKLEKAILDASGDGKWELELNPTQLGRRGIPIIKLDLRKNYGEENE